MSKKFKLSEIVGLACGRFVYCAKGTVVVVLLTADDYCVFVSDAGPYDDHRFREEGWTERLLSFIQMTEVFGTRTIVDLSEHVTRTASLDNNFIKHVDNNPPKDPTDLFALLIKENLIIDDRILPNADDKVEPEEVEAPQVPAAMSDTAACSLADRLAETDVVFDLPQTPIIINSTRVNLKFNGCETVRPETYRQLVKMATHNQSTLAVVVDFTRDPKGGLDYISSLRKDGVLLPIYLLWRDSKGWVIDVYND